jgi:radical SAM enzyme (TIGR01210 family)
VGLNTSYPVRGIDRDRWILAQRPAREVLDPRKPYAFLIEEERATSGEIVSVATIFLTNRECPWRCVMCDLWRNTLTEVVPSGAIPAQIDYALSQLPSARHVKLYNSGSFFDPLAIPPADHPAIADRLSQFERVIVECHPALINSSCMGFRDLLPGSLEIAMGLETAHPQILERLNKRMTLERFSVAADFLLSHGIDLRTFVLVPPPFMAAAEALYWAERSLDFAFHCGASSATLIATRANNGGMEALAEEGNFVSPTLELLEAALDYGVALRKGRVFADLWDISRLSQCASCFVARAERLGRINLQQKIEKHFACSACRTHN